ncbi:hypothetical protein [Amycolatopsis sp. NPDC050768]|uniref:hypothetical protein n=1 Tax=Amycolatopsis sp. NPDC050768 TaxID=3154839 RepID=UPI0033D1B13E
MISDIYIAAREQDGETYHEPPSFELSVSVTDGQAYLARVKVDEDERRQRVGDYLVVPAASLLHALQAAMADEEEVNRRRQGEAGE